MPALLVGLGVAALGTVLLVAGVVALRGTGASFAMGRRLAGAREVKVGELLDAIELPARPVRVKGRVRCADPIVTAEDDRLVAFHRDVEVELPGGAWQTIERLRETRAFDLWDHDGSLHVDPARAAEPLVGIPHVWRGNPDELDEAFAPAVERLTAEHGTPTAARATTRMVSVVDHLLVLAAATRDPAGNVRLVAPPGGYVISALELDAALRILGGRRHRLLAGAALVTAAGALLVAIGAVIALAGMLAG